MEGDAGQKILVAEAMALARVVPASVMQALAEAVASYDPQDRQSSRSLISQQIAHPHYRSLAVKFLDSWEAHAGEIFPEAAAIALLVAAQGEKTHREEQTVELVWTGPDAGSIPLRRTEQALLQVVDAAAKRIVIVSYAVYHIPRIAAALIRAAERGVSIKIIIETPDKLEGQNTYSTLKALGPAIARTCQVFYWPIENRVKDEHGKPGILHVKCGVADGRWLFLSSANLTEYAFTLNMELGLLITGGSLPEQVEKHFEQMLQKGILVKL